MQFPVPQFTDVEDKIIGPLTIKQFGIVFLAGVIVFVGFSSTKSVLVLVFLLLLFGLPALALAFVPFNGRPMYNNLGNLAKFISSPKVLIFHKEAANLKSLHSIKDVEIAKPTETAPLSPQDTQKHLREVQELLRKTAAEESNVAGRMR